MAARSDSTRASIRDLPSATWARHKAILRDLALTGPAQHRHVYESAAAEAEAHADEARRAECAADALPLAA